MILVTVGADYVLLVVVLMARELAGRLIIVS